MGTSRTVDVGARRGLGLQEQLGAVDPLDAHSGCNVLHAGYVGETRCRWRAGSVSAEGALRRGRRTSVTDRSSQTRHSLGDSVRSDDVLAANIGPSVRTAMTRCAVSSDCNRTRRQGAHASDGWPCTVSLFCVAHLELVLDLGQDTQERGRDVLVQLRDDLVHHVDVHAAAKALRVVKGAPEQLHPRRGVQGGVRSSFLLLFLGCGGGGRSPYLVDLNLHAVGSLAHEVAGEAA